MKIICDRCERAIDRDKYVDGILLEKYENIYGTHCPDCGHIIKPIEKIKLNEKIKLKMEMLKEEMRARLRKIIKGER